MASAAATTAVTTSSSTAEMPPAAAPEVSTAAAAKVPTMPSAEVSMAASISMAVSMVMLVVVAVVIMPVSVSAGKEEAIIVRAKVAVVRPPWRPIVIVGEAVRGTAVQQEHRSRSSGKEFDLHCFHGPQRCPLSGGDDSWLLRQLEPGFSLKGGAAFG